MATVSIRTPEHWWDLPLGVDERTGAIERLVRSRAGGRMSEPDVRDLVSALEETAEAAEASGAIIATQVAGVDGNAAVSASVVVSTYPLSERVDPDELADALAQYQAEAEDPGTEIVTIDVPAGPGTRLRSIRSLAASDVSEPIDQLEVRYLVVPPDVGRLVGVVAATPNVDASEEMTALFDEIVATVEVTQDTPEQSSL